MIFQFPNLETLRIALTSGQVPPEVSLSAAEVAFDAEGRPSVKPHTMPPKTMQRALKRLGIVAADDHFGEPHTVATWPEIVPLVRETGIPELAPTTPVLFDMPAGLMSTVVTEMLRLGNDRQSFRCLTNGEAENQRVLLRVIGPPYYTLLRAVDHLNADISAFVEKAPQVWIQLGHTHPLAGQVVVAKGRILLLRPPNCWATVEDGPFQDIYSILDLRLPNAAVDYAEAKLRGKLTVPLKLAPGNAADQPEMWVLRQGAMEVLDEFVRDADSRLTARLMFAVAQNGEAGPTVILRIRPSKLSPPALEIQGAVGFVPFRRLNNLFLPAGTRLHPTLRRDAIRVMLADDPAQIVWLAPLDDGRFAPQTLPDEAFLPLEDWVDYVIDHERQALQTWVQATQFDFDSFICKGGLPGDPSPPIEPAGKERKPGDKAKGDPAPGTPEPPGKKKGKKKGQAPEENAFMVAVPPAPETPDALKLHREELEREFLAVEGPLEAPERIALWPKLAAVNAGLEDHAEASICWVNSLWELEGPPEELMWTWLKSEVADARRELTEADLNRFLEMKFVTATDVGRFAVVLLWAATRQPVSDVLKRRLAELRQFVALHEDKLGIRLVWLLWLQLIRISGDTLGLAHVRDRLVERLLKSGLKKGYDIAQFIYSAGQADTSRIRAVQEHLLKLRGEVQNWLVEQDKSRYVTHKTNAPTSCYADLLFAYGLAKTGEERHRNEFSSTALAKLRSGKVSTVNADKIVLYFADAFEYRIHQATAGQSPGPLPARNLAMLEGISLGDSYVVDKLSQWLTVLEPHEKSEPYMAYKSRPDNNINKELAALRRVTDIKKLQSEGRRMVRAAAKSSNPSDLVDVLREVIPLTTRVGETFASEIFVHVPQAMAPYWSKSASNPPALREIDPQANLVAISAPVAASYGWTERLQELLGRFIGNLKLLDESDVLASINFALGSWLRALRKCGLKDQLHSLLKELTGLVMRDRSLEQLRSEYNREGKRACWIDMLRSLLHLAEFWVYFGWQDQAIPFIEEARFFLLDEKAKGTINRPIVPYVHLVSSFIRAISQGNDIDFVAPQFSELLSRMDVIPNTTCAASYCSPMHLSIVESMVLSLVSDDFILGEAVRGWLDDDEYLIRRRIHADMRKQLSRSGI